MENLSRKDGDNPEYVKINITKNKDGETGFVVPIGSPREIANKVLLLHDCPELRREMGEAGHQRASLLFRAERMARDMERL